MSLTDRALGRGRRPERGDEVRAAAGPVGTDLERSVEGTVATQISGLDWSIVGLLSTQAHSSVSGDLDL